MALILHKDHIEEDEVYNITCKLDGDNPIFISRIYTFPNTKANSEMEAVIVADLESKGYSDLSPVTWV